MSGPLVPRRLLLGTVLVGALSACEDVPLDGTRPGALARPSAPAGPDPDEGLLRTALVLEATQVARLERVMPLGLAPPAAGLVRAAHEIHAAHVDLLRGDDPAPRVAPPQLVPRRLLGRLPTTETVIAEQHATACLAAESGPFARVLASMAAAARQQAQLLSGLAGAG